MSQPQEDPIISLRLRLNMVNGIIMGLDQVAGTRQLVNYIEAQTRQQMQQMQMMPAAAPAEAPPDAPAEGAAPPPPPPKPAAKAVRTRKK